jgi:hypothetical protein
MTPIAARRRAGFETVTLDVLIDREREVFRVARAAGDRDAAWRALERLHIVSQSAMWPHIRSHLDMLGYAIALRDGKEVAGQLARLALAPLGNLTGRLPIGNTGRANANAFLPMEIPEDLQRQLKDADRAN